MAEKTATATKTGNEPGPRAGQREPPAPVAPLVTALLAAQRGAGNRSVGRLLGGALVQAKLRIGPPDDAYEREADRVADALVRAPGANALATAPISAISGAGVQRMCKECREEELQRQPAGGALLQRACSCQEEEDGGELVPKAAGATVGAGALLQRACSCQKEDDEELVQPKATGATARAGVGLEEKVASLRGSGRPLPRDLRGFFEPRFGHDFGAVRVHTGPAAGEAANAAGARAFTVGNDVVFGAGEWSPGTAAGRHLLAHELTHVVQQTPLVARRKPLPRNQWVGSGEAAGSSASSAEAEPAEVAPPEPALPIEAAPPAEVGPPATPPADAPPPAAPPADADPPALPPTDAERTASSPPQAEPRAAVPARQEPGAAAPEAAAAPSALIVEDSAEEVGRGQMRKNDFLALLRAEVSAAVDAGLAGTDQSSRGCPFIAFWFRYYGRQDAGRIDRDLPRFVPAGPRPAAAQEYIPIIAARVRSGVEAWARTGRITGLPKGIPLPGMGMLGAFGSLNAPGISFKARAGGIRNAADPAGLRNAADPAAFRDELGPGRGLDSGLRSRMESAFGRSFAHVRVHTEPAAARLSERMNARAVTVGEHVAFSGGEYRPGTLIGDALIAHELAHVEQQQGALAAGRPARTAGTAADAHERDANVAAAGVMASLWGGVRGRLLPWTRPVPRLASGLRLQRCANCCGAPQQTCATPGCARTVDVQPVFFRASKDDAAPTGKTWGTRFAESNRIWNKLGVAFNAAAPVTLIDATNKTAGSTREEERRISGLHGGSGIEVFLVDNDQTKSGGGVTFSGGWSWASIVMSDRGSSNTLLAHELGHVLGLGHPQDGEAEPGTVMEPSSSNSVPNPTRNTRGNHDRISYPSSSTPTCLNPDP